MVQKQINYDIKAIVGLGNPGPKYFFTPHNIGFLILDHLSQSAQSEWVEKHNMLQSFIQIDGQKILLIKPLTFMNNSGEILSYLHKSGIKIENILVVHDEIDFDFGKVSFKQGGSARGHNGLRSIIAYAGQNFLRLRVGVGRPENSADVGNFVTNVFVQSEQEVAQLITKASKLIESLF